MSDLRRALIVQGQRRYEQEDKTGRHCKRRVCARLESRARVE